MAVAPQAPAKVAVSEKEIDLFGQQPFIAGIDDETVVFMADEFECAARIGSGENRFLRKERFQGDIAVVFVERGVVNGKAVGVQFEQAPVIDKAKEFDAVGDPALCGQFLLISAIQDRSRRSGSAAARGRNAWPGSANRRA